MKSILSIIFGLFILIGCAPQYSIDSKLVESLISNQKFTFVAKRANPANTDVINILNSYPGTNSNRILELDNGYEMVFRDKEIEAVLPYFGRKFNSTIGNNSEGYRFTTKEYSLKTDKKSNGNYILSFVPKDISHVRNVYLEVFKNGNAWLSIDSNDRQPISYDGYIQPTVVASK